MAKMKAFPLGRRIMALLLTALMCVSLVQISAFAAENFTDQIGSNYAYDSTNQTWSAAENNADTVTKDGYTLTKSLEQTGENKFNVTLKVKTQKKVTTTTTQTPAHVVVVIDQSNSMKDSMAATKQAAVDFVNTMLGDNAADGNKVAVVTYTDNSNTCTGLSDSKADVLKAINQIDYPHGGTNTQAGIHTAQEILRNGHTDGIKDIILLMSDGVPTYSYLLTGTANIDKKLNFSNVAVTGCDYSNVLGSGSNYTVGHYKFLGNFQKDDNLVLSCTTEHGITIPKLSVRWDGSKITDTANNGTATKWEASQAKASGTEIYSVLLTGNDMDSDDQGIAQDVMRSIASKNDAEHVMTTGDASKLAEIFQKISSSVTEGGDANGTTVTDPMGKYIKLDTDFSKDAYVKNDSGTLTWTLDNKDTGTGRYSESGPDNDKTYTYTLTYSITLDNLANGGLVPTTPDKQGFLTNGPTKLSVKDTSYYFNVPSVKNLTGSLSFTKQDTYRSDVKLSGAQFTLTANDNEDFVLTSSTSNESGIVTFDSIPSGHTYTLKEIQAPDGYVKSTDTSTVTVKNGNVTTGGSLLQNETFGTGSNNYVANTLNPQKQTFTVKKVWLAPDGHVNPTVTAHLYRVTGTDADGKQVLADTAAPDLTLSTPGYSETASLPTVDVKTGDAITYAATEDVPSGYEQQPTQYDASTRTYTLSNLIKGTTPITVKKEWVAPSDARPDVTIRLLQNGKALQDYKLSGDDLSKTATVDTYDNSGTPYQYAVAEIVTADGKETQVTSGTITLGDHSYRVSTDGYTVTNTIVQETTNVSGSKTWKIGAHDALSATFTLLADGHKIQTQTVTSGTDAGYSFTNLPKYAVDDEKNSAKDLYHGIQLNGHEIKYTVKETNPTLDNGDSIQSSQSANGNYTNTLTGTTSLQVTKVWDDDNYAGRPTSVTFDLYANGSKVSGKTLTLSAEQQISENAVTEAEAAPATQVWTDDALTGTFSNLPKYDSTGNRIRYTVQEETLASTPDGTYTPSFQYNTSDYPTSVTATNTLNGGTQELTITKNWIDLSGTQHSSVSFKITNPNEKSFTEKEVTLPATVNSDSGETQSWTTTVEVPTYLDGHHISLSSYNVTETTEVPGYDAPTVNSNHSDGVWTFTNKLSQINDVTVSGTKTWVGGSADYRPEVAFGLYADSEKKDTISSTDTTKYQANTDGVYEFSFSNLPRYKFTTDDNGVESCSEIHYTIQENMTGALSAHYDSAMTVDKNGVFAFTNTFNPGTTSITGVKKWIGPDGGNVTVGLYVGDQLLKTTNTTSAGTAKTYQYTFGSLDQFAVNGDAINYQVREMSGKTPVQNGGTVSVGGNSYVVSYNDKNITNTLSQDTVEIPVTKVWYGPAASSAKFELLRNGDSIGSGVFLTLTDKDADQNGHWVGTFPKQDKYDSDRSLYTYTVREVGVGEDQKITTGNKTYLSEKSDAGNYFTNTIVDPQNGEFTVRKDWTDVTDNTVIPSGVSVRLYADGVATQNVATLNKDNNWTYKFEKLAVYNAGYQPIVYSAKEVNGDTDVGDGGSVKIGSSHFNVSIGMPAATAANDALHVDEVITNAYASTESYQYQIIRTYTIDNANPKVETGDWINGEQKQAVTVNAGSISYLTYHGYNYSFVSGRVAQTGTNASSTPVTGPQSDPNFKFELTQYNNDSNSYVVYLYYNFNTPPYTPIPGGGTVIPNPDVPTTDIPGTDIPTTDTPATDQPTPGQTTTDIPDGEAPAAEKPTSSEIPAGKTPLASAPRTGDSLAAWLTAAVVSGAGLAWLAISAKKRREKNAQ